MAGGRVYERMTKLKMDHEHGITLDTRLPIPDSVGEMFPGPATIQKVYQGIHSFPSWRGYND